MWFQSKSKDKQIKIECTYCGLSQIVPESVLAVFCKGCKKTIFHNVDSSSSSFLLPPIPTLPLQTSPEPKSLSEEKVVEQTNIKPQTFRKVHCPHCKVHQEVPSIAVQSFCENCGQRINLQDYRIEKSHFKGDLETRGEVCIAESSRVKANLNVGTALIRGTIEGKIIAEQKTELFPKSFVLGTIESPVLIMHDGAGFVGKAIIGPH